MGHLVFTFKMEICSFRNFTSMDKKTVVGNIGMKMAN